MGLQPGVHSPNLGTIIPLLAKLPEIPDLGMT